MNIGMLLNGNYPADIRVRKEAETLVENNHSVFVLCKKNPNEKEYEVVNGVQIIRKIEYRNLAHEGIIDVIASVGFVHPFFKKQLAYFIKENKIDVLHVHDLPLAKTAFLAAKKRHLKMVLDLHENYPAALMTWFSWRKNPIIRIKNNLFFSYNRWRKYESRIIKKFDVLITVVDEMKQRLIEQHNISESKIVIVPNSEKKEFIKNFNAATTNYFSNLEDKFIISYVGGFGPHRGLHTAILGMKEISKKIPNAFLVLVGPANNDVRNHLQNIIIDNNLQDFVEIRGSEPFNNVVNIMKNSSVNIIPHISNEHTESAVPHKFFQILLSGKPLLVSDCAPMKRLVNQYEIGTYFESENPQSFAKAIEEIYTDYDSAMQKAKKGNDESLNGELNWEFTSKNLVHLYNNLGN
ncbi:glycosyltransferase family 4 protein [Polaribacter uvawellassae]|uniref:glycosyltransferase family 4 protein n=1 Tax=Polaribacter uvawellassae TaxID=3133495 RepID=UPI00321BFDD9